MSDRANYLPRRVSCTSKEERRLAIKRRLACTPCPAAPYLLFGRRGIKGRFVRVSGHARNVFQSVRRNRLETLARHKRQDARADGKWVVFDGGSTIMTSAQRRRSTTTRFLHREPQTRSTIDARPQLTRRLFFALFHLAPRFCVRPRKSPSCQLENSKQKCDRAAREAASIDRLARAHGEHD